MSINKKTYKLYKKSVKFDVKNGRTKEEGENMLAVRKEITQQATNNVTYVNADKASVLAAIKASNNKHKKMMSMLAK